MCFYWLIGDAFSCNTVTIEDIYSACTDQIMVVSSSTSLVLMFQQKYFITHFFSVFMSLLYCMVLKSRQNLLEGVPRSSGRVKGQQECA